MYQRIASRNGSTTREILIHLIEAQPNFASTAFREVRLGWPLLPQRGRRCHSGRATPRPRLWHLPEPAEEPPHVVDQQVGCLHGGEVPAARELRPVDDIVVLFGVTADGDVLGEDRYAGGHARRLWPVARVGALVVHVGRRPGGAGEPVE